MITSAVKTLLHVLGYPAVPSQSNLVGTYRVGTAQTRIPGATACQIHYPTLDTDVNRDDTFVPYIRPEAVQGLADYSRQPADLLQYLSKRRHAGLFGAKPHGSFPVVVFSHGLGGCLEMYTELCLQVASMGYWVVALEHEDGSAAYAADESTGAPIYYKRPDDSPYSRQKVVNFRRPFLFLECI